MSQRPLEFFVTVKLEVYSPWIPLASGGFVTFYDENRSPLLKPIASPFKEEPLLDLDRSRLFFEPHEFPELQDVEWPQLLKEWEALWAAEREKFVPFESHDGWRSFPMKFWGVEIPRNLALAPEATAMCPPYTSIHFQHFHLNTHLNFDVYYDWASI